MKYLTAPEFLTQKAPILDVRSPQEYKKGHVPGAHSFPLFNDVERAEIGTLYKQEGKEIAFKRGLELVGPKMRGFIDQAEKLGEDQFALYCWRGGMRSASMGWLLSQYGFRIVLLEQGYKAFRNELLQFFQQPLKLKILAGLTGSGKTRVLQEMAIQGAQVIDLEQLANHQGSSFGNQLSSAQPTTEMFQNELYFAFRGMSLDNDIWLEDESICIGNVHLPEPLFDQMTASDRYLLTVDQSSRIAVLLDDYGKLEAGKLIEATQDIQRKLGYDLAREAIDYINEGQLSKAATVILTYYDRLYAKALRQMGDRVVARIDGGTQTPKEIAKEIINKYVH